MVSLPNIFKRGRESEEQSNIDKIIEENIRGAKSGGQEEVREEVIPKDQNALMRKMGMDIDKLKAEVESFKQIRQLNEQRFQRMSEELGDLRRSGIEREKEINRMKMESSRAVDLVGSVQPEKLRMDLEKEDAKITRIEAKLNADEQLISHMTGEIKSIKAETAAFRGTEAVIQLNEEVKQELANIKRVELTVVKHADKVEDIFVNIQKRFNEFLKLSEKFENLEKSFNRFMKDASKIKVQFDDLVTKEEIKNIKRGFEADVKSAKDLTTGLEAKRKELDSIISNANNSIANLESLQEELDNKIKDMGKELEDVKKVKEEKYVTEERFDKELEDMYNNLINRIEEKSKGE